MLFSYLLACLRPLFVFFLVETWPQQHSVMSFGFVSSLIYSFYIFWVLVSCRALLSIISVENWA
ncbi:hypothetical protein ASPZODRAFT_774431 [Penicilliopsis zonata CBS 506.65]|uniref:Uncharacterized protein n=1 Tax=Penicilliopsis zonata CBS 506.65 TaxID=1073090 RepID=A0A1L9SB20_9EURO|nr:hypothetical protein ASPZODRAFT_774431 [Penicilliopsis zonata CBS 506.65]OJJ44336.1 hypothetical protein ASPZODRAFT_774431 [Penicilliopsis zonata CBS 506.65]